MLITLTGLRFKYDFHFFFLLCRDMGHEGLDDAAWLVYFSLFF